MERVMRGVQKRFAKTKHSSSSEEDEKLEEEESSDYLREAALIEEYKRKLEQLTAEEMTAKMEMEMEMEEEIAEEEEAPLEFSLDLDSVSDSDNMDEEFEYQRQLTLVDEEDFLETLQNLPSLSDIGESTTTESSEKVVYDIGQFVHPLTGELEIPLTDSQMKLNREDQIKVLAQRLADERAKAKADAKAEAKARKREAKIKAMELAKIRAEEEQAESESDSDSDEFWYEHLDDLYPTEESEKDLQEQPEEDIQMLLEGKMQKPDLKTVVFEDDSECLELEYQILGITKQFLDDLINEAVEKAECDYSNIQLAKKLDKRQLMNQLAKVVEELKDVNTYRNQLNRACVKHYRQKNIYRTITEDNEVVLQHNQRKLNENMKRLDQLLKQEEETKRKTQEVTAALNQEVCDYEMSIQNNVTNFKDMVYSCIQQSHNEALKLSIKEQLDSMDNERKAIGTTHRHLIEKQHQVFSLKKRIEELEDLGGGLKLLQYTSMQSEIKIITEKINDRDREIEKLQKRVHSEVHQMSHLHGRIRILKDRVQCQHLGLKELQEQRAKLRKRIDMLKHAHGSLRQKIRNLSFKGGLIDKPLLLLDYKKCSERSEVLRDLVEGLRSRHDRLQNVISYIESNVFC